MITTLDLHNNQIGDIGAAYLTNGLQGNRVCLSLFAFIPITSLLLTNRQLLC